MCPGSTNPAGIFVTTDSSTFISFSNLFPPSGTSCQFDLYIYMNGNDLALVGFQSRCNDLQLGNLKFSGLYHHFVIVAGLESNFNYSKFPSIANSSVLVESFTNNGNSEYELNDFISIVPSTNGSIMHASFCTR